MLRLVLPKGSLEKATLELFAAADLAVVRASDVDYRATIDDPRVDEVRILRPQEIPLYVAEGCSTWASPAATGSRRPAHEVRLARRARVLQGHGQPDPGGAGRRPGLAGDVDRRPARRGARVSTEYPELTRRFLEKHGVHAEIRLSYGATEAKMPDIADSVVEITETGRALRGRRAARSSRPCSCPTPS